MANRHPSATHRDGPDEIHPLLQGRAPPVSARGHATTVAEARSAIRGGRPRVVRGCRLLGHRGSHLSPDGPAGCPPWRPWGPPGVRRGVVVHVRDAYRAQSPRVLLVRDDLVCRRSAGRQAQRRRPPSGPHRARASIRHHHAGNGRSDTVHGWSLRARTPVRRHPWSLNGSLVAERVHRTRLYGLTGHS
jgi:hypothetical protein